MSAGNLAYLIMVLTGYALFIGVLGAYWLDSMLRPSTPKAKATVVTANAPAAHKQAA